MKRILVTQRLDNIDGINEIRESIDKRMLEMLYEIDLFPIQISSQSLKKYTIKSYLNQFNADGVILSGGNNLGEYEERDKFEYEILSWSKLNRTPILGICRGLQIINSYNKGKLIAIKNHCNKRHLIFGQGNFNKKYVNSYHNFGVTDQIIGKNLIPLAKTNDQCIEALKHSKYPWLGIMWHPEREAIYHKDDLELIKNHFN